MDAPKKQLLIIGNPLLDISIDMNDNSLLDKYNLGHGLACLAT